jgi:excinuclease ABC subunit C
MRKLSKLELLKARTTEDQVDAMREHVRAEAADRPGIYRMLAAGGEVVYVGKSKRVRSRLMSYFRCGPSEKGHRILREAERIEWDLHAVGVRGAAGRAPAHQVASPALQRVHEAR